MNRWRHDRRQASLTMLYHFHVAQHQINWCFRAANLSHLLPHQLPLLLCLSIDQHYINVKRDNSRDDSKEIPSNGMHSALSFNLIISCWFHNVIHTRLRKSTCQSTTWSELLRWSRGSVLDFGTQVRGFKPGRSRRILGSPKYQL